MVAYGDNPRYRQWGVVQGGKRVWDERVGVICTLVYSRTLFGISIFIFLGVEHALQIPR